MKYCSRCGKECLEIAVICPGCGCAFNGQKQSGCQTAAKVFMVLGTIISGFGLLPLLWCIPMTVSYFGKTNRNEPISTSFKVCSLLFVSLIGGILMLCDQD